MQGQDIRIALYEDAPVVFADGIFSLVEPIERLAFIVDLGISGVDVFGLFAVGA